MKRGALVVLGLLLCAGCTPTGPATSRPGSAASTGTTSSTPTTSGLGTSAVGGSPAPSTATSSETATLIRQTLRGLPPSSVTLTPGDTWKSPLVAAWGDSGARLYVVTYGSSGCPTAEFDAAVVSGPQEITVFSKSDSVNRTAVKSVEFSCSADFAPTTWLLARPAGIDPHLPLRVRHDQYSVTVSPVKAN